LYAYQLDRCLRRVPWPLVMSRRHEVEA